MNVKGKYCPHVAVELWETDKHEPKVTVNGDGDVLVEVKDPAGNRYHAQAHYVKDKREGNEALLDSLIYWIWKIGRSELELSKAELKRRLVKMGVIPK